MHEETFERAGRFGVESRPRERAPHEDGGAFSNHARDGLVRQARAAELLEQRVRGVCQVAVRIYERAVEIEDDEAKHDSRLQGAR